MKSFKRHTRRRRNLSIKKTFLLTPEQNAKVEALTPKYGTDSQVVRVALDALFLAEGVSSVNGTDVQHSPALQPA